MNLVKKQLEGAMATRQLLTIPNASVLTFECSGRICRDSEPCGSALTRFEGQAKLPEFELLRELFIKIVDNRIRTLRLGLESQEENK